MEQVSSDSENLTNTSFGSDVIQGSRRLGWPSSAGSSGVEFLLGDVSKEFQDLFYQKPRVAKVAEVLFQEDISEPESMMEVEGICEEGGLLLNSSDSSSSSIYATPMTSRRIPAGLVPSSTRSEVFFTCVKKLNEADLTINEDGGDDEDILLNSVNELLNKCHSAQRSEMKQGLLGLEAYLQQNGSFPYQYLNRLGQTFCRIFMDVHTKVLSLFLDVLHAVLHRHAKDLADFTTILLTRTLTKLYSDLLTSVHTKLMRTLEIIIEEMPLDTQFSSVAQYLCRPTQTPNSRSRLAAIGHLYNLSRLSVNVREEDLGHLVVKMLDWCSDPKSYELRRVSHLAFYSLIDMAAPQMTIILSQLPSEKQDKAQMIINRSVSQKPARGSAVGDRIDANSIACMTTNADIQALKISQSDSDLLGIVSQMVTAQPMQKSQLTARLLGALKDSSDEKLMENHKEILKVVFDCLNDNTRSGDKTACFSCLEELWRRPGLSSVLAAFAELCIVSVTVAQTPGMPQEAAKAAEKCGISLAINCSPEILTRALCSIVEDKNFPAPMAIKMLQRVYDSCDIIKLRARVSDILSTLIAAFCHSDYVVRHAVVFALVAIYLRLGTEIQPHLDNLPRPKLKLLQFYITRAQAQPQNTASHAHQANHT